MMKTNKPVQFLGYASGLGAADPACDRGPVHLQHSSFMKDVGFSYLWANTILPDEKAQKLEAIPAVARASETIAYYTRMFVTSSQRFVVIGGDHTSAIGTWSGAAAGLADKLPRHDNKPTENKAAPLGLIWIDAHLDSHTPESSITKNLHGMPLATLLGKGDKRLTAILTDSPKVLPEHLVILGVRDYEPAEKALLKQLGVKIYFMNEVNSRGLDTVMREAIDRVTNNTGGFGISFDIDSIDPEDAPATGIHVPNGLSGRALAHAFKLLPDHDSFLGIEIAEFHPDKDKAQKTERLIIDCLNNALSKST